jgi:hypothetical protein
MEGVFDEEVYGVLYDRVDVHWRSIHPRSRALDVSLISPCISRVNLAVSYTDVSCRRLCARWTARSIIVPKLQELAGRGCGPIHFERAANNFVQATMFNVLHGSTDE